MPCFEHSCTDDNVLSVHYFQTKVSQQLLDWLQLIFVLNADEILMSLVIPNFSSRCSMRLRYSITILHHSQTIDMFPSMYFHVHESAHENEVHISKGWWKCILNFTWDGFCLFGKKLMGDGNTFLKQSSDIMNILTHMTAFSSWLPWLYNPSTIDYHKTDVTLLTFIHEMNTKVIFTSCFLNFFFTSWGLIWRTLIVMLYCCAFF